MVVTSTKEKSSKATSAMANALVAILGIRHIGVEIHVCHITGMACHNFLAMVHANISTRISVVMKSWFFVEITVSKGIVWNISVGGRMQ